MEGAIEVSPLWWSLLESSPCGFDTLEATTRILGHQSHLHALHVVAWLQESFIEVADHDAFVAVICSQVVVVLAFH
jgi:hypothetical protein